MKFSIKHEMMFFFDNMMKYSSFFGSFVFIVYVFLLSLIFHQFLFGAMYLLATVVALAIEYLIKIIHKRKRPDFKYVHPRSLVERFQESGSFPSGHTANISLFTTLIYFTYGNIPLTLLFSFISLFTAISRIYLKRHYFSDIFGGLFLGCGIGYIVAVLF